MGASGATVIKCPLPLLVRGPLIRLMSNCRTSYKCDDEHNRDLDNLLSMVKSVTYIHRNY